MFKADAKRIDWFLNLTHIQHFLRNSMAPLPAARSIHLLAPYDAGVTRKNVAPTGILSNVLSLRRPFATSPSSKFPPATSTINGATQTSPLRRLAKILSGLPVGQLTSQAPETPHAVRLANQSPSRQVGARIANQKDFLVTHKRYRELGTSADKRLSAHSSFALAPRQFGSAEQGSPKTALDRPSNFEAADTGGPNGKRSSIPVDEQPTSDSDRPDSNRSNSLDPAGATNEDTPQQHGSPVSTLHIDGSVLGRWAIQYLERTLGKPATGMTGVDPRAAIPRGRVAPF